MSTPVGIKKNSWIWQVTVLSIVLGMLLAAALKTQQHIRTTAGIPTTRLPGLVQALQDERQKGEQLRKEIASYQKKLEEYQAALGQGSTRAELLNKDLQKAKFLAGLTPVQGDGVVVVLKDSSKEPPPDAPPDLAQEYIIHDQDIRNFVNELLAAGAEAIAINGQRLIAKSAIRCTGGSIKVNDVAIAPPYTIVAIGPPDAMESALKIRGGIVDQFKMVEDLSDMVRIQKKKNLIVPAYNESTEFQYAKPVNVEIE